MTTNFPSSIDSFTNPTSSSTMASPSHSAQHADVNDAVEAIETALLDGAPLHVDDANERVGIRTTSPTASLTVTSGTDDAKVKIDSNGGSVGIIDATANTNDATGRWLSINPSGGNVGINDATPSYQLDVNGDINATGDVRVAGTSLPTGLVGQNRFSGNLSIASGGSGMSVTFNADPNKQYVALVGFNLYYLSGATSAYADVYLEFNGTTYGRCTQGLSTSQPYNVGFIASEPAIGFSGSTTCTVTWYKSAGNIYINGAGTYNFSYLQVYEVGG